MLTTSELLQIILDAWRYFDDENDLPRFETLMEAAIGLLEDLPSYVHQDVIKSLFKEAEGDGSEG